MHLAAQHVTFGWAQQNRMNTPSFRALLPRPPASIIVRQRRFSQLAENQIAAWLQQGGAKNLPKGKKLPDHRHQYVASALGVGDDFIHSKILSDNNFKPKSIERRLEMDEKWSELQTVIRKDHAENQNSFPSLEEYANSCHVQNKFGKALEELDALAKQVNDAIISDSLRFNGRSPVRHARRFRLPERVQEAICGRLVIGKEPRATMLETQI